MEQYGMKITVLIVKIHDKYCNVLLICQMPFKKYQKSHFMKKMVLVKIKMSSILKIKNLN